jgi:hypothetical protein
MPKTSLMRLNKQSSPINSMTPQVYISIRMCIKSLSAFLPWLTNWWSPPPFSMSDHPSLSQRKSNSPCPVLYSMILERLIQPPDWPRRGSPTMTYEMLCNHWKLPGWLTPDVHGSCLYWVFFLFSLEDDGLFLFVTGCVRVQIWV